MYNVRKNIRSSTVTNNSFDTIAKNSHLWIFPCVGHLKRSFLFWFLFYFRLCHTFTRPKRQTHTENRIEHTLHRIYVHEYWMKTLRIFMSETPKSLRWSKREKKLQHTMKNAIFKVWQKKLTKIPTLFVLTTGDKLGLMIVCELTALCRKKKCIEYGINNKREIIWSAGNQVEALEMFPYFDLRKICFCDNGVYAEYGYANENFFKELNPAIIIQQTQHCNENRTHHIYLKSNKRIQTMKCVLFVVCIIRTIKFDENNSKMSIRQLLMAMTRFNSIFLMWMICLELAIIVFCFVYNH